MLFAKKQSNIDWIVAFLGNPGQKYEMTRHNAGFLVSAAFEKLHNARVDRSKHHALTATCDVAGRKVLLMKPQTYMNLSGDAVSDAMRFYKVPLDHILIVSDDIHLDLGRIRIRPSGSAGGHNGLRDIIAKCGGEDFPRVRLGVGAVPPDWDQVDWVLSVFRNEDAEIILTSAEKAAKAVDCLIEKGVQEAMNRFNGY